jgi:hypothetical protein
MGTTPQQERESLVTGLIMERPLCMNCITTKATATVIDVEIAFAGIRKAGLGLKRGEDGRCRACGTVGTVYRISRPTLHSS